MSVWNAAVLYTVSSPFQYIHAQFPLIVMVHVCTVLHDTLDVIAAEHEGAPLTHELAQLGTLNGVPASENWVVARYWLQLKALAISIPFADVSGYVA